MRKNTREVFNAWKQEKTKMPYGDSVPSIWCDYQGIIWSYGTVLVMTDDTSTVVLNKTKYSRATSVHQNSLHVLLEEYCKEKNLSLLIVDNISMRHSISEMEHYLSSVGA